MTGSAASIATTMRAPGHRRRSPRSGCRTATSWGRTRATEPSTSREPPRSMISLRIPWRIDEATRRLGSASTPPCGRSRRSPRRSTGRRRSTPLVVHAGDDVDREDVPTVGARDPATSGISRGPARRRRRPSAAEPSDAPAPRGRARRCGAAAARDHRRPEQADDDHDDDRVDDVLPEQADLGPDGGGGERRRGLRVGEREHQLRLRPGEPAEPADGERRRALADRDREHERRGEHPGARPGRARTGSTRNPTDTRNAGMNSAAPKNSIRSISGPPLGTSRLSARPAKNAPTMPSMPPTSATNDADRNAASMNTNRSDPVLPSPRRTSGRAPSGRPSTRPRGGRGRHERQRWRRRHPRRCPRRRRGPAARACR